MNHWSQEESLEEVLTLPYPSRLPIFCLPPLLCRSAISRRCKPWPRPRIARSSSCPQSTNPYSSSWLPPKTQARDLTDTNQRVKAMMGSNVLWTRALLRTFERIWLVMNGCRDEQRIYGNAWSSEWDAIDLAVCGGWYTMLVSSPPPCFALGTSDDTHFTSIAWPNHNWSYRICYEYNILILSYNIWEKFLYKSILINTWV